MSESAADQNLLFGVIALQCGLIEMQQFVDACTLWSARGHHSLAEILIEQSWIDPEDSEHVAYLLQRRIKKKGLNVRQPLADVPNAIKVALASIDDPTIHQTLLCSESEDDGSFQATVPSGSIQLHEKVSLRGLHSTGGIGQIWRAHDEVLDRDIALKELKTDFVGARRHRERFFREAQLTGQLQHPGIVPVYDFVSSEDKTRCFYTMRFVEGRTLTKAIHAYHSSDTKRTERDTNAEFIRLLNAFVDVCQTVAFAHSRNVIHRDLKGDNVILGDYGEVIVLDWGLAKQLDDAGQQTEIDEAVDVEATVTPIADEQQSASLTMHGDKLGTPAYMAPEQATGQIDQIDSLTDVYGLAAILYEILTGEPPFHGQSIVEILQQVIHSPPKPPSERNQSIAPELEQICLQGLSKLRQERQKSAAELADQVQQWIADRAERKRTELERERFFNLSLDLLAIVNADGQLTQTNPAWETLLGWTPAELEGKQVREILHPDERGQLSRNLERILSGTPLTSIEHRCLCRDGSHRWVLFNANLIAGEGVIYIVGRDITDRRQTEQTFQELLESAPDAMVVVNATGTIVLANAQLQRLFGFTREELLGKPIEILVPLEARARHPAHVASFVANPSFRPMASGLELRGRRKDGSVFPVEISLSPIKTEQGTLVSCAVRDITDRIESRKQLDTSGD